MVWSTYIILAWIQTLVKASLNQNFMILTFITNSAERGLSWEGSGYSASWWYPIFRKEGGQVNTSDLATILFGPYLKFIIRRQIFWFISTARQELYALITCLPEDLRLIPYLLALRSNTVYKALQEKSALFRKIIY